jgi:hypothetical protein
MCKQIRQRKGKNPKRAPSLEEAWPVMAARFLFSCFLSNSPLLSRKWTPKLFTLFIHKVPSGVFYALTLFTPHVAWGTWSICLAPPRPHHRPTGTPRGRKGNRIPSKLGYFSAKIGKNAYLQLVLQCQIWDRFFPQSGHIRILCWQKRKCSHLKR